MEWIPDRLMTAVFAELDTVHGDFTWINCGHPPPLLIRDGHVVHQALERPAHLPLGFGHHTPDAPPHQHVRLQPGDRVLIYSDGITEAHSPDGTFFGEERLADFVIRSTASGDTGPEALRRLLQNLLTHQQHRLSDDATILLTEWHPRPDPSRALHRTSSQGCGGRRPEAGSAFRAHTTAGTGQAAGTEKVCVA